RALAPQASASANSATRTSAPETLAKQGRFSRIAEGSAGLVGGHRSDMLGDMAGESAGETTQETPKSHETEGVDRWPDLIRIDTTNFGDDSGPGERKAAEYVAGLLDEVGVEPRIYESEPGRTSVVATWGGSEGDRLLLHGHLDVVPAAAE